MKEIMEASKINDKMTELFGEKMNYEQENKNNMAYWFPLLKQIKMRVPKTILVHTGDCELIGLLDGEMPEKADIFFARLKSAILEIGFPCFLRSGMTSNKHSWKDSCFIESLKNLHGHIGSILEYSVLANIAGLPLDYSIWAVREIIPTKALFYDFHDMPITKERRVFIKDGKLICNHPYWPSNCFKREHSENEIRELQYISDDSYKELQLMAEYIGRWFTGYWSIDFLLDTKDNWWVTDMAVGERSYHYPGCDKAIN